MKKILNTLVLLALAQMNALAQKAVTDGDIVEMTAESETIFAGSEVKRFDDLKVGDKVTFRYYESIVSQIRKPGESAPAPSGDPTLVRGKGPKPSATLSQQTTASVTITALDSKAPSMIVETEDGRTMSFKVEDKKNLEG